MRFKSKTVDGFQVFAVTGVNTVSFGISHTEPAGKGLLGFAVRRIDHVADEDTYMLGFKVFPSVIPHPDENTVVSTHDHPIQSFVWDDFTAHADRQLTYVFEPLRGRPKKLDRSATPIPITVHTEPLRSDDAHDVFFNRGVASSQAYSRRFGNQKPDTIKPPEKRKEAFAWLGRDLEPAILDFIRSAKRGDALRGCFYEFRYAPVADELKAAIDRGVDVHLVVDEKVNEHTEQQKQPDGTKKPVLVPSFPRVDNRSTIRKAKIPASAVTAREARASVIAHNKFMVLLRGSDRTPTEVWTGSTNLSEGGIFGQANVGHWVRDEATATSYLAYWDLLATDPGGRAGDPPTAVRAKNAAFLAAVAQLTEVPGSAATIVEGITPVFSPRQGLAPLDLYATLVDGAEHLACATFAFGIAKQFKALLADNASLSPLCFFLLEKEDRPNKRSKQPFVQLRATNNVYDAWGSELDSTLGQWVQETDTGRLGLNTHVKFMHCKFLLRDPLGADPIVVTGSANFSEASTTDNDENMIIIRGDQRVADIYFTEFNRLFNHYYFRSVVEETRRASRPVGR